MLTIGDHSQYLRRLTYGKHSSASLETAAVDRRAVLCCSASRCAGSPSLAATDRWHVLTGRGTCSHCDESSDTAVQYRPVTSHYWSLELRSRALAAPARVHPTCEQWKQLGSKYGYKTAFNRMHTSTIVLLPASSRCTNPNPSKLEQLFSVS